MHALENGSDQTDTSESDQINELIIYEWYKLTVSFVYMLSIQ